MKRFVCVCLTLAMLLGLSACRSGMEDLGGGIQARMVPPVENLEDQGAVLTDFGLRLFQNSQKTGENSLLSPLSVLCALAMTANGAKGETLAQMEQVFGMELDALNPWLRTYLEKLPQGKDYKLSLANSIWFRDRADFTVNQDFLQTNADYYGAGVFKAPFDDSTLKAINGWVEDNTDGMIRNILDEIPDETVMYLVNALAFDAEWEKIYEEDQIHDGEFTTENGEKQDVKMMYSEEHSFLEDGKATGFVKYYKDRKYAFVALLPNEGVTLEEYVNGLTGEGLHAMLSRPRSIQVNAGIPQFETEFSLEMADALKAMGMTDAFDSSLADLSGLGESTMGNLFISRVIHKTYIRLDGKGTRAGAATVVAVDTESAVMPPEEYKTVILDRPFVYLLIDCETNLPFFIGTMMDMD